MRAVALHPDVLLATSAIWQTNCALVRSGPESFVVDSPVLPDELDALPALVEQARFPEPSALLATHADWDHLLGRLAFPGLALGCAESTAERLREQPGETQRELRDFDEQHLVQRPRPLALGAVQALPVPGSCGIGELELELHPTAGHTADGMAIWIPWAGVLLAGDYLSAVEIPALGGGAQPARDYRETLARLRPLVERATHVVPGHGPALNTERALTVLAEDLGYLDRLDAGDADAELPSGRRTRAQRARHAANVALLRAPG
ncbi:MAG TPA: MBL fold metallo-hydrolase [Solirubrobacteraceae bacterium]|nr:MBL fold metallo-hydrolase [Solirubrobacteraceae bacterium]